jgi:hypothetical protein
MSFELLRQHEGADERRKVLLIRKATRVDVPRIMEIRAAVRENKLRDPSRVTVEDVYWFIDNPGIFVWEEDGGIVGFLPPTNAMAVFLRYLWMRLTRGAASAEFCSNAPATS